MIEEIKALIESHGNLAQQAYEQYRPIVNSDFLGLIHFSIYYIIISFIVD